MNAKQEKIELGLNNIIHFIQFLEDAFLVPNFSVEISPKEASLVSKSISNIYSYLFRKKNRPLNFDDSVTFLFDERTNGKFSILRVLDLFKITGTLRKGKNCLYDVKISYESSLVRPFLVFQERMSSIIYNPYVINSPLPDRKNFEEKLDLLRKIISSDLIPTYEYFYKNHFHFFEFLFRFQPSIISTLYHTIDFVLNPERYNILSSEEFDEKILESVRKRLIGLGGNAFEIFDNFLILGKLLI